MPAFRKGYAGLGQGVYDRGVVVRSPFESKSTRKILKTCWKSKPLSCILWNIQKKVTTDFSITGTPEGRMLWSHLDSAVVSGNTCIDYNKSRSQSNFAESRDSALVTRDNDSLSIDFTGLRLRLWKLVLCCTEREGLWDCIAPGISNKQRAFNF